MNVFPPLPVVIRRSKRFGFVVVVVTGLPLWLALAHQSAPTTAPPAVMTALVGELLFLLAFLLGVLMLLRPARLTLTPEGLTYERLLRFWRRAWHWSEVSGFSWEVVGTGKSKRAAIIFTSGLRQVEVPAYWEWPPQEVLDLLNHARTTWGGRAAEAPVVKGGNKPSPALSPPLPAAKATTAPPASANLLVWGGAGLLIGAGSLVEYWWGYKDSLLLQGGYMLLVIFGWLGLLLVAISWLLAPGSSYQVRPASLLKRLVRRLVQMGYVAAFLGWLGLLVGNLLVVDYYSTQRVARLLAAGPTATTLATVTQLRERHSRSGTSRATILTYQAGAEQVSQALPGIGLYAVGQQLRVKYVVAHPDMFAVVP